MKKYKELIIGIIIVTVVVILLVIDNNKTNKVIVSEIGTEIPCLPNGHQRIATHIHPILTITIDGEQEVIPANIGIEGVCMREVHTHDITGTIHVETAKIGVVYTLTDFFAVWGEPVEREKYSLEIMQDGEIKETAEDVILTDYSQIKMNYTTVTN